MLQREIISFLEPIKLCLDNNRLLFIELTGSQHSGTAEDDLNSSTNELGNSKSDPNNSIGRNEETDDEDGIDTRCPVCEQQHQDIDK